ncbi:MAG: NUDIX hydrolase [Anaerovoracaceae bacterium]|jgi:8-oxo-dGTP diphosphatase
MKELIDIYDENRNRTGLQLPRKGSFLKKGQFMLYALALLENKDGLFLITQRSRDKKWAAGAWEVPGGGAQAGEDSLQAVCREVLEETGLDLSETGEKKPVYSYINEDLKRGDNYFVDIFHFHVDFEPQEVTIDSSEAIDFKLASLEDITALEKSEGFLHYKRILEALEAEKA